MRGIDERSIENAVDHGAKLYFKQCRDRIDNFVTRHFDYPGAWSTNRVALGWDLIRSPCNLLWAPVYLLLQLFCFFLILIHWQPLEKMAKIIRRKLPSGITTSVQYYLSDKIREEILADPKDDSQSLGNFIGSSLQSSQIQLDNRSETIQIIKNTLSQYALTRTASADISNSFITTIIGAFWFKKFTPGGIAIGVVFSYWLNHRWAVDNFFLGSYLGDLYYHYFPPSPPTPLLIASIVAVLCMLAVFASFSGLISDPIQSRLGLHRRRLTKMIDAMERDFSLGEERGFRPKDQYVARILDLLDTAKSSLL
ncbi:hypothetical protein NBRC116493_27990 [Aurantivibrio infirmus]